MRLSAVLPDVFKNYAISLNSICLSTLINSFYKQFTHISEVELHSHQSQWKRWDQLQLEQDWTEARYPENVAWDIVSKPKD